MYVDLKLEEVDRGKLQLGQQVKVAVDAIPDKEFLPSWIGSARSRRWYLRAEPRREKTFPARAT
jgi:hypothetical protein